MADPHHADQGQGGRAHGHGQGEHMKESHGHALLRNTELRKALRTAETRQGTIVECADLLLSAVVAAADAVAGQMSSRATVDKAITQKMDVFQDTRRFATFRTGGFQKFPEY